MVVVRVAVYHPVREVAEGAIWNLLVALGDDVHTLKPTGAGQMMFSLLSL
jgi:hypothetical protein